MPGRSATISGTEPAASLPACPLDDPPAAEPAQPAAVVGAGLRPVPPVGGDQSQTPAGQPLPQRVAVIAPVREDRRAVRQFGLDFGEHRLGRFVSATFADAETTASGRPPRWTASLSFIPLPSLVSPTSKPPSGRGRTRRRSRPRRASAGGSTRPGPHFRPGPSPLDRPLAQPPAAAARPTARAAPPSPQPVDPSEAPSDGPVHPLARTRSTAGFDTASAYEYLGHQPAVRRHRSGTWRFATPTVRNRIPRQVRFRRSATSKPVPVCSPRHGPCARRHRVMVSSMPGTYTATLLPDN